MNNSNIFDSDCIQIPLETFIQQFAFQINQIIPPETMERYINEPANVILPFADIAQKILSCYTVEDMHTAFKQLTETEQASIVSRVILFTMEAHTYDSCTTVCVPEEPKNYIKPFFFGSTNTLKYSCLTPQ